MSTTSLVDLSNPSTTITIPDDISQPYNLITFLAIAQKLDIDFLPITWPTALSQIGAGSTAEIRQSPLSVHLSFAFKIEKDTKCVDEMDESQRPAKITSLFKILTSEISVLGHPAIREHPNINPLLGICWDILPSGRVWPVFVFEKAALGDLASFAASKEGKDMSFETRLKLCVDVVTAVRDLHQSSIIHGDIKPENVLIYKDASGEYIAKITDFGYSTVFRGSGGIWMPRSRTWVAPEWRQDQFSYSEAQKMDAYSFGMLCLWLLLFDFPGPLNLRTLREQDTDMKAFAHELVKQKFDLDTSQDQNIDKLFSLTLNSDPQKRTGDFDKILSYLSSERRNEFKSSIDFVTSDMIASSKFSIASSAWHLYSADLRVRAEITRVLEQDIYTITSEEVVRSYAFELALCLKLGFGGNRNAKYEHYLHRSQRDLSDLQSTIEKLRALKPRYQNKIFGELEARGLTRVPILSELFPESREQQMFQINRLKKESSYLELEISEDNALVPILKTAIARELLHTGSFKEAEEVHKQLIKIQERTRGPAHPETLMSMNNLGLTFQHQGEWKKAQEIHQQVFEIREKILGVEHPDTLLGMINLASTFQELEQWKEAENLQNAIFKIQEKSLGLEHPSTLIGMNNLAVTFHYQGELKEAEKMHKQVLKIREKTLGLEHPNTLLSMSNLGTICQDRGEWEEAEKLYEQILEIQERTLGPEHPNTLLSMSNLGVTFQSQRQWKKAEKLHKQTMETRKRILGSRHPDTQVSMHSLACTWRDLGLRKEAIALMQDCIEGPREAYGPDHPHSVSRSLAALELWKKEEAANRNEGKSREIESNRN